MILAVIPGLPTLPFLALGGMCGAAAWSRYKRPVSEVEDISSTAQVSLTSVEPPIAESLRIDMIRLELGFGLLGLAGGENPQLAEQIKILRKTIATELGFILPSIRIQDNLQLSSDKYSLKIKEIEVGGGEVRPNRLLVMNSKGGMPDLPGEETREPAFGIQAIWVDVSLREKATFKNYTVVDPVSVIITHLSELVRENISDLLTYSEMQKLLDEIPRDQQKLVSDLIPSQISLSAVQRVMQGLLSERVSIRDISAILESIQEGCGQGMRSVSQLTSHVRTRLCRQISAAYTGPNGYIPLIALSSEWEELLQDSMVGPPDDRQLALAPSKLNELIGRLKAVLDQTAGVGEVPVLIVGGGIRTAVHAILERLRLTTPVLAQTEIAPRAKIKTIATIR